MERDLKTFLIPNELCRRAGIAAIFKPIEEVSIFPYEKKNTLQKDVPSNFASETPTSLFHMRQDIILFKPILRKLVNESNSTFLSMQSLIASKSPDQKIEILKLSRQYRSIIRACLENLQDEISKATASEKEELQNYVTIFYSVECVWHLCEILFVDMIPGNIVLPNLLEWVRFHFPKHERHASTLLSGDIVGLENHPEYWNTIYGSLLQGRVKVVRALLKQHSSANNNVFKLVDQILKTMPTFTAVSSMSVNEFNVQFRHWTIDVQAKIDSKQFASEPRLNLIMKLVVGEEQAWIEIQDRCETWYEFLAGWLFYTEPTVKSFELGQFAKHAIAKMRIKNNMKYLDRVLLAAMEFDMFEVIKEIQFMTESGWFVTHLTDLLYHVDRLSPLEKEVDNFSSANLRESFILDYGITMMNHKSLWQVGLSYLDHCPNDGIGTIELILPRISLDSELKTQKLVREAKLRELPHVAQTICKVQGMECLRKGHLGNALTWALKSQDGPFTSYLADKFLKKYLKDGELPCIDLLDNLESCMLASDRLLFLGKYYEFHKFYEARDFKEAANLLISLMGSKIVPNYFWHVLLTQCIPLLESEEIVFSSNDTFTIMHSLEERENFLAEMKDKIDILRLGLDRNLARALIVESQSNY